MADLEMKSGETFVKKFNVNLIVKNWILPVIGVSFKSGVLFLTSQRIVLHKRATILFYLLGAFAYGAKGQLAFDISLRQLKEIHKQKAGMLGPSLRLITIDGGEYVFVIKITEWIKALRETLAQHHGLRLISHGDSHWVIEGTVR
jgi:hypothetical protein